MISAREVLEGNKRLGSVSSFMTALAMVQGIAVSTFLCDNALKVAYLQQPHSQPCIFFMTNFLLGNQICRHVLMYV
jgi:hypothetical protein